MSFLPLTHARVKSPKRRPDPIFPRPVRRPESIVHERLEGTPIRLHLHLVFHAKSMLHLRAGRCDRLSGLWRRYGCRRGRSVCVLVSSLSDSRSVLILRLATALVTWESKGKEVDIDSKPWKGIVQRQNERDDPQAWREDMTPKSTLATLPSSSCPPLRTRPQTSGRRTSTTRPRHYQKMARHSLSTPREIKHCCRMRLWESSAAIWAASSYLVPCC
jgi:hypothetical protein